VVCCVKGRLLFGVLNLVINTEKENVEGKKSEKTERDEKKGAWRFRERTREGETRGWRR